MKGSSEVPGRAEAPVVLSKVRKRLNLVKVKKKLILGMEDLLINLLTLNFSRWLSLPYLWLTSGSNISCIFEPFFNLNLNPS